jgi:hypothetical protein
MGRPAAAVNAPALFPKRPRLPASSGSAQDPWVRQFKTFCQFEHRYVRDIRISLVTKNFFQKEDILEYFSGHCFFVTPSHKDLLMNQKQKRSIA